MLVHLSKKTYNVPVLKIVFALFAAAILLGVGTFLRQTYVYYRAIKSGESFPLLEQRLQSSWSKQVANNTVSPEDLKHVDSSAAPSMGSPKAMLTVVEFLDYDCPYSLDSFPAVKEMAEKYKDRVRFVFRDFPLTEDHPRAMPAAIAADCAHAQKAFFSYHDMLFVHANQHEDADLLRYANDLHLDAAKFQACLTAPETEAAVQKDLTDGVQVGVQGTPTFFFNGTRIQGALKHDTLEFLINQFLNGKK